MVLEAVSISNNCKFRNQWYKKSSVKLHCILIKNWFNTVSSYSIGHTIYKDSGPRSTPDNN